MERKKLEKILDQVADKWFIGIEGPTKFAKVKNTIAMGKLHSDGYPQLMSLKPNQISCPICKQITSGLSEINLIRGIEKLECGCKRRFSRL